MTRQLIVTPGADPRCFGPAADLLTPSSIDSSRFVFDDGRLARRIDSQASAEITWIKRGDGVYVSATPRLEAELYLPAGGVRGIAIEVANAGPNIPSPGVAGGAIGFAFAFGGELAYAEIVLTQVTCYAGSLAPADKNQGNLVRFIPGVNQRWGSRFKIWRRGDSGTPGTNLYTSFDWAVTLFKDNAT